MRPLKAGAIGIVVLVLFIYMGFTKFANPFSSPYTVHAVFSSANQLRPGSAVRIAGVNVGTVQSVGLVSGCQGQHQCSAADVTMTLDDNGLPLHRDATFAIRPRLFLEGNFFVDVHPGSPSAPAAPDGYTFPIQQGIEPVQLDQVLTSLQADTRRNLQILVQQYGTAVKQGGPGFNASVQYWLPAYEYTAIVTHDALGILPHDLSGFIDKGGTVAAALDAHPQSLQSLVTDFSTTAHAFATQSAALQSAVAELPRTLQAGINALGTLDPVLCGPPICSQRSAFRNLVRALVPGVQSAGPAIDASLPYITQLRKLVAPSELQGLSSDLGVTVPALAKLINETIPFLRDQVRPASSCIANVVYPWSQLTVPDSHFNASNGFPPRKVSVEAVDYLPGLAGESRDFDANGPNIRVGLSAQGTLVYSQTDGAYGLSVQPLAAAQPTPPPGHALPPLMPNVPCETQPALTDLSAPTSAPLKLVGGP